jgi:TRAP-type C4-dicarboxylate transport system substrate-binding protein
MTQKQTIRWLIAHEPVNLFLRTATAFAEKISDLTDGKFTVDIKTSAELEFINPLRLMEDGALEMSQMHITELGNHHSPDFNALELPFLFRDHDHATNVLEGKIGKDMLRGLSSTSPATGLAFTYSGGFRCIVSESEIKTIDDFKGIKFATNLNPVAVDTVEALGAVAESYAIRDFANRVKAEGSTAAALETTIPRYIAQFGETNKKFMLNTKHSLFLTAVVVSNTFWNSLDVETQALFNEAVMYAARLERKWSVDEAKSFARGDKHIDLGVSYNELGVSYSEISDTESEKFKQLTAPVVSKYKDYFSDGLVDQIIQS